MTSTKKEFLKTDKKFQQLAKQLMAMEPLKFSEFIRTNFPLFNGKDDLTFELSHDSKWLIKIYYSEEKPAEYFCMLTLEEGNSLYSIKDVTFDTRNHK